MAMADMNRNIRITLLVLMIVKISLSQFISAHLAFSSARKIDDIMWLSAKKVNT
jgi:hypothetical protein